jgi:tetratricopeptide (TPR) repeat protein
VAPLLALLLALLLGWPGWQDAGALWSAGDRRGALAAAAAELEQHPDNAELRLTYGGWLLDVQRPAAALDALATLGARDPRAEHTRATALYLLARYDEALELLDPEDPLQTLMRVDSLLALARTAEVDAALDRAATVLGERHPRVLALRGRMLAARGLHAEAVPLFRAALEGDPLDRQALFGLGTSLVRSGSREEGLAVLRRHRELIPLLDQRDFALQALALDPHHAGHHAQLGDIERQLGLTDAAVARYERATQLADEDEVAPVALRYARLLAEDRADLDGALAQLAAAAERVSDPRLPVRAGDLLMAAGRPLEALGQYRRAQLWRPDDQQIAARLAAAARAAGESDP